MSRNESPDFFVRLENHISENVEHRRKIMEQLASNDWQISEMKTHISEIKQTLTPVDAFVRSLRIIVWLAGAVLALFLWIMVEKNSDIQAMQRTLGEHSSQIGQTIALMRESMRSHERDFERLERAMEAKK